MMLSVSDVVKLAMAGVKIDLNDIKGAIDRDENLPSSYPLKEPNVFPKTLEEAFWDRWHRAHTRRNEFEYGLSIPYEVHAHEFAETVYVMVCPVKQAPFIIEDHHLLYPSDALMAKLAIYESNTK